MDSDPLACGACGFACAAHPNSQPVCVDRVCGYSCNVGFGECNALVDDGCEISLSEDARNCGVCGRACSGDTPLCRGGKCVLNDRVLVVYSSIYQNHVRALLEGTKAFSLVDGWNAAVATPSLAQLQGYGAILLYGDDWFADPEKLGDVLADYFDGGGHVVVAPFANASRPIKGRFGEPKNGYLLMSAGAPEQPSDSLGIVREKGSPLLSGVMTLSARSAFRSSGTPINGATVVAEWALGRALVLRGAVHGRNIAALNVFPVPKAARADFVDGDLAALLKNLLLFR